MTQHGLSGNIRSYSLLWSRCSQALVSVPLHMNIQSNVYAGIAHDLYC